MVGFGAALAALGLGQMYDVEQGVLRLGASGEPPFLAGFALIGIYAGLMEWLARPRYAIGAALIVNFVIILATGARAPLFLAVLTIVAVMFLERRILLLAFGGAVAAACVVFSSWLGFIRVIGLSNLGEATNLSNRDIVWPFFQRAFAGSPLFGWGVGAGKVSAASSWSASSVARMSTSRAPACRARSRSSRKC